MASLLEAPEPRSLEAVGAVQARPGAPAARGSVGWHGLAGAGMGWAPPHLRAASEEEARPGYRAFDASEYMDAPEVFRQKTAELARLWASSENTVVYTGAGISTAAGLHDYATKATDTAVKQRGSFKGNRLELSPTAAHHALASLASKGHVKHWVQQNHDRLAQKAGFPQAQLNEIHGAWGDHKNPVVMMDGGLRLDLLQWLEHWGDQADFCVALGTSLCGMNADQVPQACASKYPRGGNGLVIIGLQRTVYDEVASLRIWGLCDDVMADVCKHMRVPPKSKVVAARGREWQATHPSCTYHTPKRRSTDPL